MNDEFVPQGQLLIYSDGALNLQVRLDGQTVWLTQAQMAELYQTTPQNITLHIRGIYDDGELPEEATCKEYLQVRQEGSREVQRTLKHYKRIVEHAPPPPKPRRRKKKAENNGDDV